MPEQHGRRGSESLRAMGKQKSCCCWLGFLSLGIKLGLDSGCGSESLGSGETPFLITATFQKSDNTWVAEQALSSFNRDERNGEQRLLVSAMLARRPRKE